MYSNHFEGTGFKMRINRFITLLINHLFTVYFYVDSAPKRIQFIDHKYIGYS